MKPGRSPPRWWTRVLLSFNHQFYQRCVRPDALQRLASFAEIIWDENGAYLSESGLQASLRNVEGVLVGSGSPKLTRRILEPAEKLRLIADLDADRFAQRLDIEYAFERGIRVVDTTNASSYPVSEWALALILISLRNAGEHFRKLIHREPDAWSRRDDPVHQRGGGRSPPRWWTDRPGFANGELTGKRVGIVGGGHVGRRLIQLLQPFRTEIRVYDPYLPKVVPDIMGFLLTRWRTC